MFPVPKLAGRFYKDIYLSSVSPDRDDYFLVILNKKIVARIFLKNEQWYIWYEKPSYRIKIGSFLEAVNLIEKEVLACVE